MRAILRYRSAPGEIHKLVVAEGETVIGRDPGATLCLPLKGISRHHSRVVREGETFWIEDLRSTNGTFLNGKPVKRQKLANMSVITLGREADLVFVLGESTGTVRHRGVIDARLRPLEGNEEPVEIPRGELSVGRSSACSLLCSREEVSKLHARIERGPLHVVVRDLASANGTFVNGIRVQTSPLRDGDTVCFGGVESFRVELQLGEVVDHTGSLAIPDEAIAEPADPELSQEWRTRFDWDSAELRNLEALRRRIDQDEAQRGAQRERARKPADAGHGAAPARAPVVAPRGGLPPTAKAAVLPKPASAGTPAPAPAPTPPVPPPVPTAPPVAAAPPSAPPAPPPRAPTPPPAVAAPPPVAAAPPPVAGAPPVPAALLPITEVRLDAGSHGVFSIREPGGYEIGRAVEAGFRLVVNTVSRRHCRVTLDADRAEVRLEDLGATTPTRCNGARFEAPLPLADGDVLDIGHIEIRLTVIRG